MLEFSVVCCNRMERSKLEKCICPDSRRQLLNEKHCTSIHNLLSTGWENYLKRQLGEFGYLRIHNRASK